MHRVTGRTHFIGKGNDPGGETLNVMEQHDLGHLSVSLLRLEY